MYRKVIENPYIRISIRRLKSKKRAKILGSRFAEAVPPAESLKVASDPAAAAPLPAAAEPQVPKAPAKMVCKPLGAAVTKEWCEGSCTPVSCAADLCDCEEDKSGARASR